MTLAGGRGIIKGKSWCEFGLGSAGMTDFLIKTFIRDSEQVHDPAVRERYGVLSGVVGILLNLLLSAGKLCAGVLSASISITCLLYTSIPWAIQ